MHRSEHADRKKKVVCISCARNKHKMCDLHMNDGAFDADDFISVRCDCFCAGRIGTQYDSLMAMAEDYAKQVEEFQEEARQVRMLAARAAGVADEVMEIVRTFDARARDDEGNLLVSNRREHVDRVLDEFFAQLKNVATKSEAVLALIAEDSGFTAKDIIDRIVEMGAQDDRDDESDLPPEGFDDPIDDGSQGGQVNITAAQARWMVTPPGGKQREATPGELDMIRQHELAQVRIAELRAAQANEEAGWPVD